MLAAAGVQVLMSDLFGPGGHQLLTATALAVESRARVDSLLRLITALDFETATYARLVAGRLRTDPGYAAVQQIPGVGPLLGAVFVAEIGDINRFGQPQQLASWAGLTPTHRESDTTVRRGRITKQGSRLVRWAAVEAVQRVPAHTRSDSAVTGSGSGGAATSGSSPQPGTCSHWCSTGYVITTSAACTPLPVRREQARERGGRGSCES